MKYFYFLSFMVLAGLILVASGAGNVSLTSPEAAVHAAVQNIPTTGPPEPTR
jgi:hypothetical protein